MQSSKPFSHIIDEPSESNLTMQFNVKELISFTFGPFGRNTVNLKMLQIVLHLLAHQLNMLEQVVEIQEEDRAKAIQELKLQQKLLYHLGSDVSGTEQSTSSTTITTDSKYISKDKKSIKKEQFGYASTEESEDHDKSVLDEPEDVQKQKDKKDNNRYEKDSKKRSLIQDTPGERKFESDRKRTKRELADDILTSDESDNNREQTKIKKKMRITSKKRPYRPDDGTFDEKVDDEKHIDEKSVVKMATKTKKGQMTADVLNESEDDETKTVKRNKDKLKSTKSRTTDTAQPDQDESDNDKIRTDSKEKNKITTKLEKETESNNAKQKKEQLDNNIEKRRQTDDVSVLDETDDNEPIKTKKDKERKSKKPEKGRQSGKSLVLDETVVQSMKAFTSDFVEPPSIFMKIEDDEEHKTETKIKEKRAKKSDKGQRTDGTPISDEVEYDEENKTKKTKKDMASKSGKRQRTDEMPISDELEDDDDIKTKGEGKIAKKSDKGRHSDEGLISEKIDDEEKNKIKRKKVAKESKKERYEVADDDEKINKKRKHTSTKKTEMTDDSSVLDESEDSESKKEKVFKKRDATDYIKPKKVKDDVKSVRRETDEEASSLNKPEDDENEIDRQIKFKKEKIPHRSGKDVGGTKSDISHKKGKKPHESVSVISRSSHGRRHRQDSIQLATMSEFGVLQSRVQKLQQQSGPVPMPTMPDNKTLKDDLAKGSVILPATMEAMQLQARVAAAEEGLHRMSDLLSQLSDAGAFPPETSYLINQLQVEHGELSRLVMDSDIVFGAPTEQEYEDAEKSTVASLKSVGVDAKSIASDKQRSAKKPAMPPSALKKAAEFATQAKTSILARALTEDVLVTRNDMKEALKQLKDEMIKNMKSLTEKATESAERANVMARCIVDKLDMALGINNRIDALNALSEDYALQLKGFDSGLGTQLLSLHEQMKQMQTELKEGLALYDTSEKLESTGVTDLRTGYTVMGIRVHNIVAKHTTFIKKQADFTEELTKSIEFVEALREQKADRDEIADGLRDKVDVTRLRGIPDERTFEENRDDMQRRLAMCYNKFKKQEEVWSGVMKDLQDIVQNKAEAAALQELEDYAEEEFDKLREKLNELEIAVGVPKTALMVRHIPSNRPGPSKVPEVKGLTTQAKPQSHPPPSLPSMPHDHPLEEQPCMTYVKTAVPSDSRKHNCKRFVGGSHTTMLTEYTTREEAKSLPCQKRPTRCYTGMGADGRAYVLEEELQPCIECNEILLRTIERESTGLDIPVLDEVGAGDQKSIDGNDDSKKVYE